MAILNATDLTKDYYLGQHVVRALDNVSLSLEQGEFVAIMGPSGSGKSTMLHLLGGLDRPTAGKIVLAGKEVSELPDFEATLTRRRSVGFVFQFFNLLPTLSAEENVMLPLVIDGKNPAEYRSRLDALFARIGLEDRRHHRPDQLSGGEQQRVAIARALITEPALLLADEPTGNLDTKTGTAIMELLRELSNQYRQATVIVTHDPRAASYADRIVFLRDGAIVSELLFSSEDARAQRVRLILASLDQLET